MINLSDPEPKMTPAHTTLWFPTNEIGSKFVSRPITIKQKTIKFLFFADQTQLKERTEKFSNSVF